jgi:PBSX family phage terminase large subunit
MMPEVEVLIPKKAFIPCYWHLLGNDNDINLLWGGRDSGKSHFIAQYLIYKCLNADYFRCIMVKKTANSIEAAQWQTIKDIVTDWGFQELFRFKSHPLSIECINGNKFIARGCDDPDNLKSIKDPSDVWYEEANQLSLTDFITVATTLRSKVKVQQWVSFNPEAHGDYEEFWLYKTFFANYSGDIYKNFTSTWSIDIPNGQSVQFTYTSTHTTYHNNPCCKSERKAFLEQLAALDPFYYLVFTEGKWGNQKVDSPYCYCFNPDKHKRQTEVRRNLELYLSYDFNVNPITCGVYQHEIFGETVSIRGIESIKLDNSDIYKLCDYIVNHYPGYMYIVTGDATGQNTSALVQDGINYYTVIKSKLGLAAGQLKVPTVNPPITENRVLVNAVFHKCDVAMDPFKCKHLIFDCQNVSMNDVGKIDKGDRSNPKKRADHLDHFRYYLNTFFRWVLKQ